MVYTGRKVSVGIWKETVRGTAVAPSLYYAHLDFTPQDKVEYKENEASIGVLGKVYEKQVVKKYSEIPLTGILGSESAWYFFLAMLGQVSSAETAETGAYQHDFSLLNSNSHPTFTIVEKNDVEGLAYPLGWIEKLGLAFEQWDYVNLDSSWKANLSETMALTPTYSEETKFLARQIEVFIEDDIASLDGGTAVCVESGNLEITKEIEQIFCLGDIAPKDLITKVLDAQINLTVRHNSTDYSDYQKNGTEKALRVRISDPNTTIWNGADIPVIELDFPKVVFDEVVKEGWKDDIIKQNLTISGLFDLTSSELVTTKIVNLTNTY